MTKALVGNAADVKEVLECQKIRQEEVVGMRHRRIQQITFVICLAAACYVCFLSGARYYKSMVQTVIDRVDVHISEIPFPSVTLCPPLDVVALTDGNDTNIKNILDDLKKLYPHSNTTSDFNDESLGIFDLLNDNILNKMSYSCEELFEECTWRRIKRNCCSLFREMLYGKRVCYAFNSLVVEDPAPTWPWSETLSGRKTGLKVVMNTNASVGMPLKIMAMVHYPEDYISSGIYLHGNARIALDALQFYADSDIRQLVPEYRHCYFSDEIRKYDKSVDHCKRDCRVGYIDRMCNCTLGGVSLQPDSNKVYCNVTHVSCIYLHIDGLFSGGNIFKHNLDENSTEFINCNCYPNCNYVQYRTFVSYDLEMDSSNANKDSHFINMEVYYLRDTIFSYRTAMVYSLLDLTVALCSIVALFLGVSFIGIIKGIQDYCRKRRKAKTLPKAEQKK